MNDARIESPAAELKDVAAWCGVFSLFIPLLGLVAMYLGVVHGSPLARALGKFSSFLWLLGMILLIVVRVAFAVSPPDE